MRRLLISSAIGVALVSGSAAVLLWAPSRTHTPTVAPSLAKDERRRFVLKSLLSATVVALGMLVGSMTPAQASSYPILGSPLRTPTTSATLLANGFMWGFQNQELISPNGRYQLVMQTDGNLVLYDGNRPIWASNTVGK